jgi:hypothetical protein
LTVAQAFNKEHNSSVIRLLIIQNSPVSRKVTKKVQSRDIQTKVALACEQNVLFVKRRVSVGIVCGCTDGAMIIIQVDTYIMRVSILDIGS